MRHSRDDAKWIRQQLERIPQRDRQKAVDGYSDAYQSAYDAEQVEHRKENAARFAANTRLRKYAEKILALR